MTVTIKKRDRSPNYPFITLEQALVRASEFYRHEKRGAAPVAVAVTHWDYSPKSSGGIQTIAALKNYGLMEDEGRGDVRNVRLTETALRILLDSREDPGERAANIQRAATNPPVFSLIREQWPDTPPSPGALNHHLIFSMGFSPEGAKEATRIFLKNSELARFYTDDAISSQNELPADISLAPQATESRSMSVIAPAPTPTSSSKTERIIGPTGDIVLQFVGEPTLEAYEFLEGYIKLRKGVLGGTKAKAIATSGEKDGASDLL